MFPHLARAMLHRPSMDDERRGLLAAFGLTLSMGLWLISLAADVAYRAGRGAAWDEVAFLTMFAGLVCMVLVVVPPLVDDLLGAGTRLRIGRPGRSELDLVVAALFVVNLGVRAWSPRASLPVALSFAGLTLLALADWLAGQRAQRDPRADVRFCLREVMMETRRRRTARSA